MMTPPDYLPLLLTYRDIQDYDAMIELVEALPDHNEALTSAKPLAQSMSPIFSVYRETIVSNALNNIHCMSNFASRNITASCPASSGNLLH